MTITPIFKYLNDLKIEFNQSEFKFQINTHNDYPSILSISDTLSFFKIENFICRINEEDLEIIGNNFIALIEITKDQLVYNDLVYVNIINDIFVIDKKEYTKKQFLELFKNIVIIIDKKDTEKVNLSKIKNILIFIFFCIITLPVFINGLENFNWLFQILSFLGIYLSIETFNQSIGVNKGITSKFCSASPQTSCESVVKSNKWKVFKFLSFSDVSIVFFVSQLLLIIGFTITNNFFQLISFTSNFIWLSIPMILVSIYFQKYVEKKWCPLCLAISTVLIIETLLVYSLVDLKIKTVELNSLFSIIAIFYIVAFSWFYIKNLIIKNNEFKKQLIKAMRFKRNYNLFKEQLLKSIPLNFPKNDSSIYYGNKEANCQITILTSPFCGYCKKTHEIVNDLYIKYEHKIGFHIVYSADINEDTSNVKVIKNLQQLFKEEGLNSFKSELYQFYNIENYLSTFLNKTKEFEEKDKINEILILQNEFALINQLNFTPILFINGYKFPEIYENEDLEFFINDLIEDEF
jgi:hypothetical protein